MCNVRASGGLGLAGVCSLPWDCKCPRTLRSQMPENLYLQEPFDWDKALTDTGISRMCMLAGNLMSRR